MRAVRTRKRSITMTMASVAALMLASTQAAPQSIAENIKPVGQVCLADQPCVGTRIGDAYGPAPVMTTSADGATKEPTATVETPGTAASETAVAADSASPPFDAAVTYQMNCFACHGTGAAGAPLLGEAEVWEETLVKGMEAVMVNVINGLNAMPARGLCASCSDDDLRALIDYMISQ